MWNVIGGRLGFVQFPESETEPAKCGPETAQALQNTYKNYLWPFDKWYIRPMIKKRMQEWNLPTIQQILAHPAAQQLFQMANLSVAELAERGVHEKTIQLVEKYRLNLQRLFSEWTALQIQQQQAAAHQPLQRGMQGALYNLSDVGGTDDLHQVMESMQNIHIGADGLYEAVA